MSVLAAKDCLGTLSQVKCLLVGPLIFIAFACAHHRTTGTEGIIFIA